MGNGSSIVEADTAAADWWIQSKFRGEDAGTKKLRAQEAVTLLNQALPVAHTHPEIKKKIKELLSVWYGATLPH